jgi:hypothetical protein
MAELDRHRVRRERLDEHGELVELARGLEGGGELHEERAQLAGVGERLGRSQVAARQLAVEVGRRPHAAARRRVDVVAQLLGERVDLGAVAGHRLVHLDVEREVVGRDLRPALDDLLGRHGVPRRVHLDAVEVLRVPGQQLLLAQPLGIPLLDEAWIRPRARADDDATHPPGLPA